MELGTAKQRRILNPSKKKARHKTKHSSHRSQAKRQRRKLRAKESLLTFATDILVAIVSDGFNTLPFYRYADYLRDIDTIKTRVRHEGLYFVVKVLPGLATGLFDKLEGRLASFPGFVTRNDVPVFLHRCMLNAVEGRHEYVRFIYQVSVAFKKLAGTYSKDSISAMWTDYISTDERLRDVDLFGDNFPVVERARMYAKKFFADFDPFGSASIPRPGPGATNTPLPHYRRFSPTKVFDQIDKVFPVADWFYNNPWEVCNRAKEYLGLPRFKEPCSRYKTVPKTALSMRGICIEENEVQYMQQALRRALTKHIDSHPLYCSRIALSDQSTNQWLAMEGSKSRTFATIDLSSASDLIARELVSWIVQDNEDVHDALMALSTKWVKPPPEAGGPLYRTAKFAPMGSAICFPVMSLMFMFLIRAAISLSDLPYPHLLSTNVFVYGDDIVVPSVAYELVCRTLESVGLKVNANKSFVRSYFRESCGVHAYQGVDVTPIFVRKHPSRHNGSSLISLIETEFQFYSKGYLMTASVLRAYGSTTFPKYLARPLYVEPDSSVVGWKRLRTDTFGHFNVPRRPKWNSELQRYESVVHVFVTRQPSCSLVHASEALLRWIAVSPEPFESRTVLGDSAYLVQTIARRKVPTSCIIT